LVEKSEPRQIARLKHGQRRHLAMRKTHRARRLVDP
jgi:hypothetical protein